MRVIQAPGVVSGDEAILEAFSRSLEEQDLAAASRRAYLHDLKLWRAWLSWLHDGELVSFVQVTTLDLSAFRKHLIQEKGQRPNSVNRRVQSLKLFYRWLMQQGYIDKDPAQPLRFVRRGSREMPRALQRREALALLYAASSSLHGMGVRNTAIVQLMLQTGLRVGEVSALKRGDLIIKERSGTVRVREGKGMKAREVPLNLSARRALSSYFEVCGEEQAEAPAFVSKRACPLSVRGIQNVVATLAERAKIDRIPVSAHTLRHTFAYHYLKSHPDKLVELASLLGHESLDTTAIYLRPAREDLADDLETSALNVLGE